jgi:MraZ protein
MQVFVSTHVGKLDEKLRVSVPSSFRQLIEASGGSLIYAYPSFRNQAIEVLTIERMQEVQKYIEALDLFSQEREALETSILAASQALNLDSKGRVMLSGELVEFAGIEKDIIFVGKGRVFEIWSPVIFKLHYEKSRLSALKNLTEKGGMR